MASLQKREEFKKYVGYFEGSVIAVNPNQEKLASLGINVEKEPEYTKDIEDKVKDEDGEVKVIGEIKQTVVTFYIQDVKTKTIFTTRYFLKNKLRKNNEGTKFQFMNSQGASTWAESESQIAPWFTQNGQTVRKAYDGEADLYDFIKTWLNKADFTKDYELVLDWKKLISGNVKEITDYMKSDIAGTIVCPATVKPDEKNDKEYQQIWNKGIISSGYNSAVMKQLKLKKIDADFIENADTINKENKTKKGKDKIKLTPLQRSVLAITDGGGKYACPDFYYLGELKEYNSDDDFVRSNDAVVDSSDASY